MFFTYLQLGFLTLFTLMLLFRIIAGRLMLKVNPFALHFKKHPLDLFLEISTFALFFFWVMVLLFALLLETGTLSFRLFSKEPLFDFFGIRAAGAFIISLSLMIYGAGLFTLGESFRIGTDPENPGKLVIHGVYSRSRNPIFLFYNLYLLGSFLMQGRWFFLISFMVLGFLFHLQILREERFLKGIYGPAYEDYLKRVGRYWSFKRKI